MLLMRCRSRRFGPQRDSRIKDQTRGESPDQPIMRTRKPAAFSFGLAFALALALVGFVATADGESTPTPTPTPTSSPTASATPSATPTPPQTISFKHIIVIVQENRTPDNLFGSNVTFEPGVDLATSGINSLGDTVPLTADPLSDCYDMEHSHHAFVAEYDAGKMDREDKVRASGGAGCIIPPNPGFKFVDNSTGTVQPYFDLAAQYGFANRMFQTNQGPSFPAHQFIFAGTSAPDTYSPLFAAENVIPFNGIAGCTSAPDQTVRLIDPTGREDTNPPIFPCFEHPTLTDLLDAGQFSWKYYTPLVYHMWTAPTAINHICLPQTVNGQLVCTGSDWTSHVVTPQTTVLTDIKHCDLPSVSWVIPTAAQSDHAGVNKGLGPAWVASIVNQIGTNAACPNTGEVYWSDTAVVITWDDWGGWYDHVPPYRIGQDNGWGTGYTYGLRVPLIVVSAYTPAGYVDNANHDFGSILSFIETNFGLGLIDPGSYADAYADNLGAFFPLASPRSFLTIATPFDAQYFITHPLPLENPDDD
jgi:phospholipase C